jgi:protease-4
MDQTTPPPLSPAPPLIQPPAPPPPPARAKCVGWKIAALILLVLLVFSVIANVGQLASGVTRIATATRTRAGGPRLEEALVEDNESRNKIAVISIEGVISSEPIDGTGYNLVELVKAEFNLAEDDPRVKAVVLKVDSPGGEVLASDEIASIIRSFQKHARKPVIVSMGNLAASGGYYVSSPCRWIVANELSLTGSIGVIMSGLNYRGLLDKVGVQPNVYKSGKFKDMLSGTRNAAEIPPEERKMVQDLIDETYGKFKSVVAEGRTEAHKANGSKGRALADNWTDFADGRVMSGTEAYEHGLVDELGDFDDAVSSAMEIAGIQNANVVEYERTVVLADLLRMFGKTGAGPMKVDLGIDLPRLKAGQPYFLSPTYLH